MTLLQTHSHSPSGEMTAGIADSPSWLSLSHLKSQVYFGASKLLKVDITNKANIYLSLFHSMASSSSPKQDTFNSSLITVLFTQQKSWTRFEAQVTKPNAMLACRPWKDISVRQKCLDALGKAAAPREGALLCRIHLPSCWATGAALLGNRPAPSPSSPGSVP